MKIWTTAAVLAGLIWPAIAHGGEAGDTLAKHLYAGTASQGLAYATERCNDLDQEACFAEGIIKLVIAYEGIAQDLYRYGATTPGTTPAAMLFGMEEGPEPSPANPNPEPLSYLALRTALIDFVADLDQARMSFERAGASGDYVVVLDPMRVRLDLDGNGEAGEGESLAALLGEVGEFADIPEPDAPPPGGKTKNKNATAQGSTIIGFDRSDALWFAGYMQVIATPVDLVLAHDFPSSSMRSCIGCFPRQACSCRISPPVPRCSWIPKATPP